MSEVLEFVKIHPYLFANLPALAAVILLPRLAPNRDYRKAAVFSGLACLPCSLAEMTSGEYWHPVLVGGGHYGIESLIFTYVAGAAVWLTAALWNRDSCALGIRSFRMAFLRLLPSALTVTAVYGGLWLGGMECTTATLLSSVGFMMFLLGRRLSLWRLALTGIASFTPVYVLTVKMQFAAWPDYISYWNFGGTWGTMIWGIPRGEVAWAAMFGAAWPVVIASALDISFGRRESLPENKSLPPNRALDH